MNLNASTAGETKIETIELPFKKAETRSLGPKLLLFYCTSELLTPPGAILGAGPSFERAGIMRAAIKHLRFSGAPAFLSQLAASKSDSLRQASISPLRA
jgi:hypothetical protein